MTLDRSPAREVRVAHASSGGGAPTFRGATIAGQAWTVGEAVDLVLPEAEALGDGVTVGHFITPALPGRE